MADNSNGKFISKSYVRDIDNKYTHNVILANTVSALVGYPDILITDTTDLSSVSYGNMNQTLNINNLGILAPDNVTVITVIDSEYYNNKFIIIQEDSNHILKMIPVVYKQSELSSNVHRVINSYGHYVNCSLPCTKDNHLNSLIRPISIANEARIEGSYSLDPTLITSIEKIKATITDTNLISIGLPQSRDVGANPNTDSAYLGMYVEFIKITLSSPIVMTNNVIEYSAINKSYIKHYGNMPTSVIYIPII